MRRTRFSATVREAYTLDSSALVAILAVDAFARFGRGRHRAALNFGDCLAYATARSLGDSLLFVGDAFAHTDIIPA